MFLLDYGAIIKRGRTILCNTSIAGAHGPGNDEGETLKCKYSVSDLRRLEVKRIAQNQLSPRSKVNSHSLTAKRESRSSIYVNDLPS